MLRFRFELLGRISPVLCLAAVAAQAGDLPKRPQTPQPPFPYLVRDVAVVAGPVRLAGTLTLPKSIKPVPAVVLAPGAGAVDRDNTILEHKPFLVIADFLARRGIGTLRLDSRGVGGSTGSYPQTGGEERARDLVAAVEFLRQQPEVDSDAIGLLGHSEGGTLSAMAAAESPSVKFLVLLAAPGLPDTELFVLRIAAAGGGKGISSAEVRRLQEAFRAARARMARGESDPEMKAAFQDVVRLMLPAGVDVPPPALAAAVDQQIASSRSPNGAFLLTHDPRVSLRRVRCPVFALQGSKDQNVPPDESLAAIRQALDGNPRAKTVKLTGLNHFLQTAITGSSMEVGQLQETISPQVLDLLAGWIESVTPAAALPADRW